MMGVAVGLYMLAMVLAVPQVADLAEKDGYTGARGAAFTLVCSAFVPICAVALLALRVSVRAKRRLCARRRAKA